jgi:general stress protein 26
MHHRKDAEARLWAMIKDIKVAMLTSWDGEQLHARPMHGHQEEFTGKLYFFTRLDSGKTHEIGRYDKINLAYVDLDDNDYVSVSGRGHISTDREQMRKYWNPMASAWFPQGLDDPQLALIEVSIDSAQYWDATASTMRHLWEVARANLTGRPPDLGENEKLRLGAGA